VAAATEALAGGAAGAGVGFVAGDPIATLTPTVAGLRGSTSLVLSLSSSENSCTARARAERAVQCGHRKRHDDVDVPS